MEVPAIKNTDDHSTGDDTPSNDHPSDVGGIPQSNKVAWVVKVVSIKY